MQKSPAKEGKFAPIKFGSGGGAVAEINDSHISYKGNIFTRFNPVTSFVVANHPWGEVTSQFYADWFVYDPNHRAMKSVGGGRSNLCTNKNAN